MVPSHQSVVASRVHDGGIRRGAVKAVKARAGDGVASVQNTDFLTIGFGGCPQGFDLSDGTGRTTYSEMAIYKVK